MYSVKASGERLPAFYSMEMYWRYISRKLLEDGELFLGNRLVKRSQVYFRNDFSADGWVLLLQMR